MPQETSVRAPLSENEAGDRLASLYAPADKADKADKGGKKKPDQAEKPKAAKPEKKKAPERKPEPVEEDDADDAADPFSGDDRFADEDAAEDDAATEDEGDEGQSDEDQGDDADGQDDADEGDDDESEQTFEVTVNGETHKVGLEELIGGYQRQADYTQKTKVLAQQRKELEAAQAAVKDLPAIQKATAEQGQVFTKNASLVLAALQQKFMPQKPDANLIKTNPVEFYAQKERFEEAGQFMNALSGEVQKYHAGVAEQQKQDHTKAVTARNAKLFADVPEFKDDMNRRKFIGYAKALGYTDDNIAAETDPRLFIALHKAMKWDELQKSKAELKMNSNRPKVFKQTKAAEGHKAIADRKQAAVIDNHHKSKSINSAAAAIEALSRRK